LLNEAIACISLVARMEASVFNSARSVGRVPLSLGRSRSAGDSTPRHNPAAQSEAAARQRTAPGEPAIADPVLVEQAERGPALQDAPKPVNTGAAAGSSRRRIPISIRLPAHASSGLRAASKPVDPQVVPRRRPWRVRSPMDMAEYWTTADADPRAVYRDVLIALDEARGINNGQPSLWAFCSISSIFSPVSESYISVAAPATIPRSWPNSSGLRERSPRSRSMRA
jgi:hypothetical protein